MSKLSTGQPSTLGSYYDNCCAVFGSDSAPARYFAGQIAKAKDGRDEAVLQDETQVMQVIYAMLPRGKTTP